MESDEKARRLFYVDPQLPLRSSGNARKSPPHPHHGRHPVQRIFPVAPDVGSVAGNGIARAVAARAGNFFPATERKPISRKNLPPQENRLAVRQTVVLHCVTLQPVKESP